VSVKRPGLIDLGATESVSASLCEDFARIDQDPDKSAGKCSRCEEAIVLCVDHCHI